MKIKEILGFIRIKITLMLMLIPLSSYLIFNEKTDLLLPLAVSSFCIIAASYAFNMITDKEEDKHNKKINPLAYSKKGPLIIAALIAASVITSLSLSGMTLVILAITIILSPIYSYFRIKKIPLMKNMYTAATAGLLILFGAGKINSEVMNLYLLTTVFFLTISIVSDIRDKKGDEKANAKTIPTIFGQKVSIITVVSLLAAFSTAVLIFNIKSLSLTIPFAIISSALLLKNRLTLAHSYLMKSMITIPLSIYW